jgi:hypothetical protein
LGFNYSTGSLIEVINMHKKDARDADQPMLNSMEQMRYISNAIIACNATERLYGKRNTIALQDVSIGSNYGSQRVVL